MDVLFVSDSTSLKSVLAQRHCDVIPSVAAARTIRKLQVATIVYVDPGSPKISLDAMVSLAAKNQNVLLGVIDPKSKVKNVMTLVHKGLADYIGAADIPRDLNVRHFKAVETYVKKFRLESSLLSREQQLRQANGSGYIPVPQGWKEVQAGREYSFSIMFIEMDDREEMENRYGVKNLSKALAVFRTYIERHVSAFGGRIWLWSNFGGLALFPFNGSDCHAVICAFRICAGKYLHDAEESHFPNFISFRIALHLGNLFYQEKNKGEVIADSLNSVFHLGQKFAEPGRCYLTEDVFKFCPATLKPYFLQTNSYENRLIYRMKNMVF
jgi:hypothetical protein